MYTCANGCRYSHGGWSSQEKKRMPQKNGSSLRTSIHPQIKHGYVSQLKERTSASKRYVATTREEKNIFLLVLEFSNHLPRFRPCLYISWEALVFFSFCACMSPQYISNLLLTTAVYSWSGVYFWRPLLLGFMHSGRCGNTKHEQVAEEGGGGPGPSRPNARSVTEVPFLNNWSYYQRVCIKRPNIQM